MNEQKVIRFPTKVYAMCGKPATESLDLVDEYGDDAGQKYLCDNYPFCDEDDE